MNDLEKAETPWNDIVDQDDNVCIFKDGYPVSIGHLLFVPKYNDPDTITTAFYNAYVFGIESIKSGQIDGFNIGMNFQEAAGQTVMYPHIHFIPRYHGDVEDPTGGVRNVIPHKGNYKKNKDEN